MQESTLQAHGYLSGIDAMKPFEKRDGTVIKTKKVALKVDPNRATQEEYIIDAAQEVKADKDGKVTLTNLFVDTKKWEKDHYVTPPHRIEQRQ